MLGDRCSNLVGAAPASRRLPALPRGLMPAAEWTVIDKEAVQCPLPPAQDVEATTEMEVRNRVKRRFVWGSLASEVDVKDKRVKEEASELASTAKEPTAYYLILKTITGRP